MVNGTGDGVDSYFLTDANFDTVLSNPYDITVEVPSV